MFWFLIYWLVCAGVSFTGLFWAAENADKFGTDHDLIKDFKEITIGHVISVLTLSWAFVPLIVIYSLFPPFFDIVLWKK